MARQIRDRVPRVDEELDPFPLPRTVHPRKSGYVELPIVAVDVDRDRVLYETTGELDSISGFAETLAIATEPAIVAVQGAGKLVAELDAILGTDPRWQWRATIVEREYPAMLGFDGARGDPATHATLEPIVVEDEVFGYFGFKSDAKKRGRWYHVLDPAVFGNSPTMTIRKLLAWASDVRDFCRANDLPIRPTAAGLTALLLRDARFYPEARRKVPQATNERAREHLPGNYYRAVAELGVPHKAWYIDQESAHHRIAAEIELPHADDLFCGGYFDTLEDRPWCDLSELAGHHGLLLVKLRDPRARRLRTFPHPIETSSGSRLAYVFTNELDYLAELGITIDYVVASWTSEIVDEGLRAYARWAIAELANRDPKRTWLKPMLLSAYGLLAVRPRKLKAVYKRGNGDEVIVGELVGHLREATRATQIPIANVVQRGMIEAEVRVRSLRLAREIEELGGTVLSIYADGILYEGPTLLLPVGWRYENRSERLFLIDDVSIVAADLSDVVKLPGRSGAVRDALVAKYRDAKTLGH